MGRERADRGGAQAAGPAAQLLATRLEVARESDLQLLPVAREPAAGRRRRARRAAHAERRVLVGRGEPQDDPLLDHAGQGARHVGPPVGGGDHVDAERAPLGGQARHQLYRLPVADAIERGGEGTVPVHHQHHAREAGHLVRRPLLAIGERPSEAAEQPQHALLLVAAHDRAAVRQRLHVAQLPAGEVEPVDLELAR